MTPIRASRPNVYTGSPLDRAGERRDDAAWIDAARARPDSLHTPVWRARSLMRGTEVGEPQAAFLGPEAVAELHAAAGEGGAPWAFLGTKDGVPVFAVDVSAHDDPEPLLGGAARGGAALGGAAAFADLRSVPGLLSGNDASVLAHARGLMHWRSRHRFCGVCGGVCEPRSAGNVMVCALCNTSHFPRTDPAVIMLVTRGEGEAAHALLGHSQRFPNSTMYSTLAGFVEPGEALEEAVAREVFEEAGIRVGAVHYHSSQPWPFPASIMLGFYAEALTEEITIDPSELMDAKWFSRAQMRNPREHGFQLPRGDSIARRLIEDWLEAA